MNWEKMNNETRGFWESLLYGQPKKDSTAMATTWMDLPLEAVKKIETPSGLFSAKKSQLIMEFDIVDKKGFWGFFRKNPKVVVHIDNRDMWRTQIEFHRRKLIGESAVKRIEESEEEEIEEHEEPVKKSKLSKTKSKKPRAIKKMESKTNFCGNCGAKINFKVKFCPKCGEKA